jgi:hypothetical protein
MANQKARRLQYGGERAGKARQTVSAQRPWNHFPAPHPKPLSALSRPQLAARLATLRRAMDLLAEQAELDGCAVFPCIGRMKGVLIDMENDLRASDKAAQRGEPLPHSVAVALAGRKGQ